MSFASDYKNELWKLQDSLKSAGKSSTSSGSQNSASATSKKKKKQDTENDIAPVSTVGTVGTNRVGSDLNFQLVPLPDDFNAKDYNSNLPTSDMGLTYVAMPEKDERTWFQKSGVFDDGYQFGDISKVILGTAQDVTENLTTGVVGMGEKAVDALAWIGADLSRKTTMDAAVAEIVLNALTGKETDGVLERNLALQEKIERDTSAFIQKDLYDEEAVSKKILSYTGLSNFNQRNDIDVEADSVLGEKSDALVQSGGQLLATAGLQMVGVPWWLTTGATSFGGEVENALNQGASFGEAGASAAISAAAEILTEKLSGGIKFGGNTLDDVLLKPLTERIASKGWKFLVDMGIDAVGEGTEEVISGFFSNLGTALYREEDLSDILFSEQAMDEYLEGFVGGAVLGGVSGGIQGLKPDVAQDVITKEYNDRVDEAQSDGKKLTAREKSRIYKDVVEDVESGAISTDRIEEILGGDTYKNYKAESEAEKADREEYEKLYRTKNSDKSDADVERQAELKKRIYGATKSTELRSQLDSEVLGLVKGTRLEESYNEKARRGQKFEADVSQYNEAQRKVIQSAIDSGILNNTNRTHRFVDMVAKISADKGVSFDFTNNARLKDTGFAVDGAQVNAYVTKDGITLNINSAKALNSVVGHEISHVLEGTELYSELQSLLFNYAESKGDLKNRRALIEKLYKNVKDANVDAEITADLIGDYLFTDRDFIRRLSVENKNVFQKIFDEIKYLARVATAGSKEARDLERVKKMFEDVYKESGKTSPKTNTESELREIGLEYDSKSETVSYSLSSLEDAFGLERGAIAQSIEVDGNYQAAEGYIKAREEYVNALAKSIALDKDNVTDEEYAKANNYLDGLFLIGEMIAKDTDRLDYEAAVDKSSWVSNSEYGGSIDFSTLCAKRRLFTGTFDAIQNQLPDTVLNENDFLQIRNMLLEKDLESPCSMCYVEGSRAKHGEYVAKFLKEYLATDPEWKPQIADFTSSVRLEQTRINHPEAYNAYTKAMNKLAQRKPKEASVRTDYKGEILVAFEDGSSVEIKNQNGGIRFNSFSDFEIIHALDCMQVITDMARVGLNGQAYTKVAEFAEAFGNTGLKINLSLVAKDVDANGRLIFDEVNGMKYSEAMRLRNEYSENVGTVIVAFNEAQIRAALADKTIDYVLPFHRSQWKKSQYTMMGLPNVTKDFTMQQNDRIRNPKTGKPVKLSKLKHISTYTNDITGKSYEIKDNIMPNQYWDWDASGRENAQRYLDYINSNGMTPKFDFLLEKVDGEWTLPEGDVGDGYFKLLIDFKMYDNDGWGSPQRPVLPEFNMSYIQKMLNNYTGGHQAFPVAHDVVDEFVKTKTGAKYSLSENTQDNGVEYAPVGQKVKVRAKKQPDSSATDSTEIVSNENVAPVAENTNTDAYRSRVMKFVRSMDNMHRNKWTTLADGYSAGIYTSNGSDDVSISIKKPDGTFIRDKIAGGKYWTNKQLQVEIATWIARSEGYSTPEVDDVAPMSGTKLEAMGIEIEADEALKQESLAEFNDKIAKLQEEYDSKRNKNTKVAQNLLVRIERLKRMRDTVDAEYSKRIENLKRSEKLTRQGNPTSRRQYHNTIIDRIKKDYEISGLNFDDVLKNARNLSTFATVDNTPQRVIEKTLGYREGQIFNDLTVNKVAQHESEGIKWLNSYTSRSDGVLAKLSKKYKIKPGSKESAAAQMYAEGFFVDADDNIIAYGDKELKADFPDAKTRENIKGLANDPLVREIYDQTLDLINKARTRNAYPEIPRLENYFLHFRAMEDTFSKLGLPFNPNDIKAKDLPTDLNGVTADLQPGQPYFASAKHRTGKRTSFDLLGGLERYLTSAKNQIYHIDDIQTLRALRNYIAETFGQAQGLENLDALTDEEAEQRIRQVYGSHLSNFAKFLNEEANIIAGKTALIDRGLEGIIGRRGITFLTTLNSQVGSNMVGMNVSSSLTNFLPVVQTFAKSNKFDFLKAFAQTASNKVAAIFGKGDNFAESSPVVIRRKGADRFYRTPYQKLGDFGYTLMSLVDDISTELIARTKYNEFTRKGMESEKAHYETDKWVSRLMGDRSIGQMPQLFNSKTLGLITKFQLEVRNQLDAQFYDTIQEAKASKEHIKNGLARNAAVAAKVTSAFVQLAVLQHVFGQGFEAIAGYNPAFDIIEVIATMFGWDDDDDSEDTVLDNIEQGFLALMEDLPYTSTLTGGRVPIASALPIRQFVTGKDEYGNEKSRWETLAEAAPYYVLPGGYGQIKKTVQGLNMFSDDNLLPGSYTDSGRLRFTVDKTPANVIQAALFGQYASKNAREYFDEGRTSLTREQTKELLRLGIPIQDYWEYRDGLKGLRKTEEYFEYVSGLDLTTEQKNLLINNLVDRREPIDMSNYDKYSSYDEYDFATKNPKKYDFLEKNDISYEEYSSSEESKDAYDWAYENPDGFILSQVVAGNVVTYRKYTTDLYNIHADKDANGKSISGSRKEKVIDYINNMDADYGQKLILFKSEYPSDDTYNYEIIEYLNSRDDISYSEMKTILIELGFTVDANGNISW